MKRTTQKALARVAPTVARAPRRRRKEARPSEIVQAALDVFAERGFGAAKMDEVARRAGVAKGTVFVYFPNKEELFRAVARAALKTNLEQIQNAALNTQMPVADLIPLLLAKAAGIGDTRIPAILRLIIAESRIFPDLARVWYDEAVSKMFALLTGAIERAQARGEIHDGDARLMVFSIVGPMMASVLFREVFQGTEASLPDLHRLASQHTKVVLSGLLLSSQRSDTHS